jgi:hypothetical protein
MLDDPFGNDECDDFDSEHNKAVCRLGKALESSPVYEDVKTDHTGGEQPESRGGFIPDVEAESRLTGETAFFEVDSGEPSDRDKRQHDKFSQLTQNQDDLEYDRFWTDDLL